jgi:hypothetical protein
VCHSPRADAATSPAAQGLGFDTTLSCATARAGHQQQIQSQVHHRPPSRTAMHRPRHPEVRQPQHQRCAVIGMSGWRGSAAGADVRHLSGEADRAGLSSNNVGFRPEDPRCGRCRSRPVPRTAGRDFSSLLTAPHSATFPRRALYQSLALSGGSTTLRYQCCRTGPPWNKINSEDTRMLMGSSPPESAGILAIAV